MESEFLNPDDCQLTLCTPARVWEAPYLLTPLLCPTVQKFSHIFITLDGCTDICPLFSGDATDI